MRRFRIIEGSYHNRAEYLMVSSTVKTPNKASCCSTYDMDPCFSFWTGVPLRVAVPSEGIRRPAITSRNVDLPAPEGPMTATQVSIFE